MGYYSAIKKNEIIVSHAGKMAGTGDHHVKQNKLGSKRQLSHFFSHSQNLEYISRECKYVIGGNQQ
jgi:hypothetical protein